MIKNILTLVLGFNLFFVAAQTEFITTWKTDNPGVSEDNQITIPTFPGEVYDYLVDWGDGTTNSGVTGNITHTYANPGTYTVKISGLFPRIYFNSTDFQQLTGDENKLISIENWGANHWKSMESAFAGCRNLRVVATDMPDLSGLQSLRRMFYWSGTFRLSGLIIPNIENWDISNVTDLSGMFSATTFHQEISNWNVRNVKDMSYLFFSSSFDGDISNWDVSNVTNMAGMFGSGIFGGDVTKWNVGKVTNMAFMFDSTYFDQDISSWDVSNVKSMHRMFSHSRFNQDIGSWNVSQVTDMTSIFDDNDLSRENYDKILIGWSQLPSLHFGTPFGAKDVQYCLGKDARSLLISSYGWNIIDQGENCEEEQSFVTTWKTDNIGFSKDNQITIPTNPRQVYNYNVDWGDGTSDTGIITDITHTYTEPGTYQVSISGRFPSIYFNSGEDVSGQDPPQVGDANKILSVDQWGTNRWITLSFAFAGCSNLDVKATDIPDFSKDIFLSGMFSECTSLKGNESFAQWDMGHISASTSYMFYGATQFNQPIGQWDVSKIGYLDNMFKGATSFNQNLEHWNIGKAESLENIFNDSGLSTRNYDKILKAWSALPLLMDGVKLGASNTSFCTGDTARQSLLDNHNWIIDDAGKNCSKTYFTTTWKTDNPGVSADNQITIPTFSGEVYDYTVDWGDKTTDTGVTGDITHTYANPGTYKVKITGKFPRIYFLGSDWSDNTPMDNKKLLAVEQWGDIEWSSMEYAFLNCTKMDVTALDTPLLSTATNLNSMFNGCYTLQGVPSFATWEIGNIEQMSDMFADCFKFNQDIGSWDVSNVTNMAFLFSNAQSFDSDISIWNVSNVVNMGSMFQDAYAFNQDISAWDVSQVTNMANMFFGAKSFNQNIDSWNVDRVDNMNSMFSNASAFNQDIGAWNVSLVTDMANMFFEASSFDQNLGDWDIKVVSDLSDMFKGAQLSTDNYDKTLIGWNNLPTLQNTVILNAGDSEYCEASEARQNIIDIYGWTIADAGESPLCNQDNDTDGVMDHKDDCLNTRPGVDVNGNGCEIIPNDVISVYVLTPNCVGSSDGSIEITMNASGYLLNISIEGQGIVNTFDNVASGSGFKIDNLPVGAYSVTVSIPEVQFSQTYGVTVNEVSSVSAKRVSFNSKFGSVSYSVLGSKSYEVSVNGKKTNYRFDHSGAQTIALKNLSGQNEVVISGESDCQGRITDSFFIGDAIQVFPTISAANVNLLTNGNRIKVRVFSMDGRMVKELTYDQAENNIDISTLKSGVYILRMATGAQEETVKIIKK